MDFLPKSSLPSTSPFTLAKHNNAFVLVMNTENPCLTPEWDKELNAALDEVEKSSGPAVLVTTNSNPELYHAGIALKAWRDDPIIHYELLK